ncbi:D-ribose ABC transporter substrate-binding protein [Arthrobacter sp. MMS18-M83]|uniref:D-ribose ABC transporter substrate-binding protein n=1 Tax=Arthrobacter sp. MMS18-M83 TaxID=2996261 RepID=UPI00227C115D|nr:D-ribose ABC transporter substrate-binding protein [Arthrobacter sp. MMS18-M83]WAH96340.1 D-ribose ABC transporter substrate-binding protein [Arthrobacter sp. MMS18-M83]
MNRKAAAIFAAGVTLLTLAGCGSSAGSSTSSPAASGAGGAGGAGGKVMTVIVNDPANPYWATEGNAAKAEGEKLGYKVNVNAHKGDTKTESDLIDAAITNKSAAILLDPANADGSIGAVQKATSAGIPVILVNAEINKQGLAKAQLVSNNAQGAALGAQEFVKAMGSKGTYVELKGAPSDNNAATRSNGFATVLSQYPDLKLLESQVANWDQKQGHDKMQSMLQAHPDIQGVLAGNDQMALGAIAALKEAGKLASVKVGGFDGAPDAVDAVKAGSLSYTVLQPVAAFSVKAVDYADQYIKTGKTGASDEKQAFDCTLINKDNAASYTSAFTLSK